MPLVLGRRLRWLRQQAAHTRQQARTLGLKAAVADRLAAAVAQAPSPVPEVAAPGLTIEQLVATVAGLQATTDGLRASLAAAERDYRRQAADLAEQRRVASDERHAALEWLWHANAPLAARPLISVIVPTADRRRLEHLRSAIDSVLAQTYHEWQLVVVDDSESGILDPVPDWWPETHRVEVVRCGARNNGHARNAGLAAAAGDLVTYLDDDCRWFPWWLHSVAAAFSSDPDLVIAHGVRLVQGDDSRPTEAWALDLDPLSVHVTNPADTNVLAHRRGTLVWPTEATCNDYELAVGMSTARSAHIPVPAVNYSVTSPGRIWAHDRAAGNMSRFHEVQGSARRRRPLRVVAHNAMYPVLSETYIGDELLALQANGIDVVLSREVLGRAPCTSRIDAPLYDSLDAAIGAHDPDAVLMHWAGVAGMNRHACAAAGVPWMVRYHSFDARVDPIDFVDEWCAGLFHHRLLPIRHRLARPVDTLLQDPGPTFAGPRSGSIMTLSAALPKKGWDVLFDALSGTGVHLDLIASEALGFEGFGGRLADEVARRGTDATVRLDVEYAAAQQVVRQTGALVYPILPGNPIGQPCSVIEAAIAGTPVVVPECAAMRDLVGDTAHFYEPGSVESLRSAILVATHDPHSWPARLELAERARERHCGAVAHRAWAEMLTRCVVSWRRGARPDAVGAAQRWWQPEGTLR